VHYKVRLFTVEAELSQLDGRVRAENFIHSGRIRNPRPRAHKKPVVITMAIRVSVAELPGSVIQAKTATNSGVRRSKEAVHSGIEAETCLVSSTS